jgi:hypothetical protein
MQVDIDVPSISAIVAAAGVIVGVVLTYVELRHQTKIRKTDLLVRLFSSVDSKDWLDAWEKVNEREILDYNDYKAKYGFVELNIVFVFFEQVGKLLQKGLIDMDLIPLPYGQVNVMWEKIKPIVEMGRNRFNEPKVGQGFEYLHNEMKKREQRGVQSG